MERPSAVGEHNTFGSETMAEIASSSDWPDGAIRRAAKHDRTSAA